MGIATEAVDELAVTAEAEPENFDYLNVSIDISRHCVRCVWGGGGQRRGQGSNRQDQERLGGGVPKEERPSEQTCIGLHQSPR